MLKKHFNPKRELKKVQKKGIYNPKTKLIGVFGLLGFIALTCSSYALFTFMSNKSLAFNSKSTKIVKITLNVTNGKYSSFATKILADNEMQTSDEIDFSQGSPKCSKFNSSTYSCDEFALNGSGLYSAKDDDGPSYYFRGTVDNNNVNFAGKKWKILRIFVYIPKGIIALSPCIV